MSVYAYAIGYILVSLLVGCIVAYIGAGDWFAIIFWPITIVVLGIWALADCLRELFKKIRELGKRHGR